MRFWITKNNESPVREQLVRQVILGILSEDLPVGNKLPSVRAFARRHRLHPNTVSSAYQYLRQEGWLEARRGSGLYVRKPESHSDGEGGLDHLLAGVLAAARAQGYGPAEVLQRLHQLVRPRVYQRILLVEPEAAMREILQKEIASHVSAPVDAFERYGNGSGGDLQGTLVVALPTRAVRVRRELPQDVACFPLRLRSVNGALEGQPKPEPDVVVTIVSRSSEVRHIARTMLLAVGLPPESLCEIDATCRGWSDRLTHEALVVTDVAVASELPSFCRTNVFRLIADSSLAELKQCCRASNL